MRTRLSCTAALAAPHCNYKRSHHRVRCGVLHTKMCSARVQRDSAGDADGARPLTRPAHDRHRQTHDDDATRTLTRIAVTMPCTCAHDHPGVVLHLQCGSSHRRSRGSPHQSHAGQPLITPTSATPLRPATRTRHSDRFRLVLSSFSHLSLIHHVRLPTDERTDRQHLPNRAAPVRCSRTPGAAVGSDAALAQTKMRQRFGRRISKEIDVNRLTVCVLHFV